MPSTTIETNRDELLAEYVARSAFDLVQNRIRLLLEGEDRDVLAKMPGDSDDGLVNDARLHELFQEFWPGDVEPDLMVHSEVCYLTARILRSIVYHAEYLRSEADYLFNLADKHELEAKEASVDA